MLDIMETTHHLVLFIERFVQILSNPLFSYIQDPLSDATGIRVLTRFKSQLGNRVKGSIVIIAVTSLDVEELI